MCALKSPYPGVPQYPVPWPPLQPKWRSAWCLLLLHPLLLTCSLLLNGVPRECSLGAAFFHPHRCIHPMRPLQGSCRDCEYTCTTVPVLHNKPWIYAYMSLLEGLMHFQAHWMNSECMCVWECVCACACVYACLCVCVCVCACGYIMLIHLQLVYCRPKTKRAPGHFWGGWRRGGRNRHVEPTLTDFRSKGKVLLF